MKVHRAITRLLLLAASLLLSSPASPTDASCVSAPQQLDDWETTRPEDVGLDAALLCKIAEKIIAKAQDTQQLRKELQEVKKLARERAKAITLHIPQLKDCKHHFNKEKGKG